MFAIELEPRRDRAAERETEFDCAAHRHLIGRRQCSRMSEADGAHGSVGRQKLTTIIARAKHFRRGRKLNVNFKTNDGFELHSDS